MAMSLFANVFRESADQWKRRSLLLLWFPHFVAISWIIFIRWEIRETRVELISDVSDRWSWIQMLLLKNIHQRNRSIVITHLAPIHHRLVKMLQRAFDLRGTIKVGGGRIAWSSEPSLLLGPYPNSNPRMRPQGGEFFPFDLLATPLFRDRISAAWSIHEQSTRRSSSTESFSSAFRSTRASIE